MLTGTLLIYGFPLFLGILVSIVLSAQGDLWAAAGFCLGTLSGFAILQRAVLWLGGAVPGFAEPQLAGKANDASPQVDDIFARH